MPTYYTVDRSGSLKPGRHVSCDTDFQSCRFFPVKDHFTRADLEKLTLELFPNGLTLHGKRYLLDDCLVINTPTGPAPCVPHIPMIELISELVRRSFFPDKPSRLTALFAWESLEKAIEFKDQNNGGTIYEVQSEFYFKGDMNLLYLGGTGIGALQYAIKYWQGSSSPTPRWECLLVPPIQIISVVNGAT